MMSVRNRFGSRAASVNAANSGRPNEYSSMLTSTVTTPPATDCPGFSVVVNATLAPVCSTARTRSAKPMRITPSDTSAAGHKRIGAAKYQMANVAGSHASTTRMKRVSGENRCSWTMGAFIRKVGAPWSCGSGRSRARWRRSALFSDGGQCAHPDQPHDQHVEHDERLPDIKVRPFEYVAIPLSEIEQADHADDVQALHRDDADRQAGKPVLPRRGEREHRRNQHDRRLDAVAAGLDRHRESVARRAQ